MDDDERAIMHLENDVAQLKDQLFNVMGIVAILISDDDDPERGRQLIEQLYTNS